MQLTQALLEDSWRELVTTQIDATPDYPRELVLQAAANNGMEDASAGRYYPPDPSDQEAHAAYVQAWQQMQDTLEYEDDIEDRAFWGQGSW